MHIIDEMAVPVPDKSLFILSGQVRQISLAKSSELSYFITGKKVLFQLDSTACHCELQFA